MIKLIIMLLYMRIVLSYINSNLINSVQPSKIRKYINEQLNINYNQLSYKKAKDIMHTELNNIDIYGDNSLEKNVEHIFPQSLFKNNIDKTKMKSDLHNLYLCNSKLNTQRQNFKYISHEDYIDNYNDNYMDTQGNKVEGKDIFKKQGYMMIFNKKTKKFIPTLYSRGMISRSLGYFSIKYDLIEQLKQVIDINTLIEWNLKDPPTDEEYLKNIICYKYQKNYNPFIFDSDLLIYAFSDMCNLDDNLLQKKRINIIDPLYSIDFLVNNIIELEKKNILLNRENNRLKNKYK